MQGPEGNQEVTWLSDLQQKRVQNLEASLGTPPTLVSDLTVSVWSLPQKGARVWWSMPALYYALDPKAHDGHAGQWCGHGWAAWTSLAQKLQLDPVHARLQQTHNNGIDNLGLEQSESDRLLQEKSLSSIALLGQVGRFCSDNRRFCMRSEIGKACCRHFLVAFLAKPVLGLLEIPWTLFLKPDAWAPPSLPTGRLPIKLSIKFGEVDLEPVMASGRVAEAVFKALGFEGRRHLKAPVPDMLVKLSTVGPAFWLFRHLVIRLGCICDEVHANDFLSSGIARKLQDGSRNSVEQGFTRYWVAGVKHFVDPHFLSIAIDGSRVSQKSTMAGIMCLPSNMSMVIPPQASGPNQQKHRAPQPHANPQQKSLGFNFFSKPTGFWIT